MPKLHLHSTLTRQKEPFESPQPGKVSFYHCGPTVYWTQHIGNLRGMVMGDLIRRTLQFSGYQVTYVRNYTDVGHLTSDGDEGEDKMEKAARREHKDPMQIAQYYTERFEHDLKALNILTPSHSPRATDYIGAMQQMIQDLLDRGYAYITERAIYFDTQKFSCYYELNRQKGEENRQGAGSGELHDQEKKHPADFSLWFFRTGAHIKALQYWSSPFHSPAVKNGEGFPGWHLECSAMAKELLGKTIDIHMGGVEHIPVHHTNEIAQSECANGETFVRYWLHNEHLTVDDRKMAKSEGTSYALSDVQERGFHALDLRYFFLTAHYRSRQNFTWEALEAAKTARRRLVEAFVATQPTTSDHSENPNVSDQPLYQQFQSAISDDVNIPQALGVAWQLLRLDEKDELKHQLLLQFDRVLGLQLQQEAERLSNPSLSLSDEAQQLLAEREQARQQKNWVRSDELRDQLQDKFGIEVKDTAEGQKVGAL